MTITYDAEGRCTRCGSTGYYLGRRDYWCHGESHSSATLEPCPCRGWGPVEWAKDDVACDMWSASVGSVWLGFRRSSPEATHFRPRPEPPEVE